VDTHGQIPCPIAARSTEPLDPDLRWRREDIHPSFMRGMEKQPVRRLLARREVADLLAVSVSAIQDLVRRGKLSYITAGRGN